jgi:TonB-linked SusC/RagA family outer membrane protein
MKDFGKSHVLPSFFPFCAKVKSWHASHYQMLLTMKLTIILMTVALLQVHAGAFSQKVTITGNNLTLKEVFSAIRKQAGYDFFYGHDLLNNAKSVTLNVKDGSVDEVLALCFEDQPLTYYIEKKTVFISARPKKEPETPVITLPNSPPPFDVHGRITDSLGIPLQGATVQVRGSKKVVVTDVHGNFTLYNIDPQAVLEISYTGYQRRTIALKNDQAILNIHLLVSSSPLDVAQVIAYGTNTRRFSVGSVSTVTSGEIEQQPVTNPLLALQGRVPGLTITPMGGTPGSSALVQVRGQNALKNNTSGATASPYLPGYAPAYDQPLFIVDGVPFAPQNSNINLLSSVGGSTQYSNDFGGFSPFTGINPMDIESITVLKDADATSIYGTQGANGVILITTKKGKPGKTQLSMSVNTGPNRIARQTKMMNTAQYLQLRHEAFNNDGITPDSSNAPDLFLFDTTKNTNWSNQFFGKTSNNTDVHASLSGGTVNTTFIGSVGYTNSTYNFPGDFAENRYTLHSAFHHNSVDHRLTFDLGTDYSYDRNNSSSVTTLPGALALPPDYPNLVDPSGNLVWNYKGLDLPFSNYDAELREPSLMEAYTMNTTMHIGYQLLPGLNLGANLGYSRVTTREAQSTPLADQFPAYAYATANFANSDFQTINLEPQLDYKRQIGKGTLSVLAGTTYKKVSNFNEKLQGTNYPNDALMGSIVGAPNVTATNGNSLYKYDAGYGRIGYVYNQEYIVSLTGRRDGSSNFGPGRQFGNFGSAGAGWIFSEEKAFNRALPFISYAKLSATYGTNGSDGIAPYQYQPFWAPIPNISAFQGVRTYEPTNLYNPDYSWATKKAWNIAADFGLFHDRVLINATWYRNRTGNQLTGYTLPIQTGFSSVSENSPATVQDIGWEFSVSSVNIKTRNFTWSSNFNITSNRNKLISFPGLASSAYSSTYAIGKSTSIVYGYKSLGVNDTTGVYQYSSSKGTPTYNPNYGLATHGGDMQLIEDLQPKFYGGLGNTFTYKDFSLMAFFQFSKQTALNYLNSVYQYNMPGEEGNEPVQVENRWKKPGDHSDIQRATTGPASQAWITALSYFTYSNTAYSDDSYIRLKTLAVSYNLSGSYLKKLHIQQCRVYINVQNLLTITDYKVGDPESPGRLYSIPTQRIFAGGLSLTI